ncbi:phospholipid-transporting ATPase ABCA1 isoform X2 [Halyomorpha halys]|uniref:phospholipid-transporting ATPase ABCA1 isoform X2 n=1 Tax=Halyomorpha halys TaxID=286706 RepID=UPI0034D36574
MAFWLQLRLILWKNFIIRKRQKIRVIVELTWPLFLFLILMWVRTRGLRSNVGECHFTEKAMPSTGFLPFFQSFFCTFNNTCHNTYNSSLPKSGDLTSGFMKIFEEADHIFRQSQTKKIDFRSIGPQLHNFSKIVENVTEPYGNVNEYNGENSKLFNKDINNIKPKNKGTINSLPPDITLRKSNSIGNTVERPLMKNHSLVERDDFKEAFNELEKSLDALEFYSEVLKNAQNASTLFKSLDMAEVENISGPEKILVLLYDTLCGREVNEAVEEIKKIGGTTNRFDQLQDQFRDRTKIKYTYDNDTTPMCNQIFQKIEGYPPFSMLWRILKPFLVGKILYTPVTEATKKVMERVNTSFYPFLVLHSFATNLPSEYTRYPQEMNSFTSTVDLRNIKEFLDSEYGKELVFKNLENDLNRNDRFERSKRIVNRLFESTRNLPEDSAELFENSSIIIEFLKCLEIHKVEGIDDHYEAEARGMQLINFNKLWALIEFESPGDLELNPLITYKIRMNTERVDNTEYIKDLYLSPGSRRRPAIDLKYITYGFAYLQDMIDHSIITEQTGKNDLPGIVLQQFPYPCYIDDEFIMAISRTFPLFMVLSWVYTCAMIVKSIVHEKEQRLKETMRVMGLGNTIHWIGWFIDSIIPMLFTILLLTLILVFGNILRKSDPVIIYIFLLCYALATISQSFFISVFFSRANLAAASAGIIFFVLYLPYPFIVRWMFYLTSAQKFILALSSNVAFGLGASYLALYEEKGTGIQWKYFASSPYYNDNFSLLSVITMLLVDFIVYMFLTWYIEHVFPGQFGIPKPWYFPLTWNYWSGKDTKKVFVSPEDAFLNENDLNDNYEPEPLGLKKGVSIHNLKKQYSNGKVAVNDISINFYEGQITSFLGHNGAGKTTTISILTGLFPPSSGTAKINGFDIRTDMDEIRKNLGMCPQHNVLFNRLTVEEHLWFYACLRGGKVSGGEINGEIDQMINDLGLPHKRKALSTDLSGGMQRKLSIAVSFIGGSKVVILDEPTSGVDPFSRRSIWELLLKYKTNRTVILTTHYMDEADLLGDRIAIIANGKVQCCGSSVFLKNKYGSGYHLTVEIPPHSSKLPPTTQFDLNGDITGAYDPLVIGLTKYIQNIVNNAIFVEYIGSEASYILPDRDNTDSLMSLCDHLEKDKDSLGILSYGISDTSLEEIFLRVAENDPANDIVNNNNTTTSCWDSCFSSRKNSSKKRIKDDDRSSRHSSVPIIDSDQEKPTGDNLYWKQFIALHVKRLHHTRRNKKALFSELVLPAVFVCMSLLVSSIFPKLRERPPIVLEPWRYPSPNFMFYSNNAPQDTWTQEYIQNMKGPDGIGAKCIIINGTRNDECGQIVTETVEAHRAFTFRNSFAECSCESGAQVCPANIGEPEPPHSVLTTRDILYNMTGDNIPMWIVNTWPKYEEHRFGGYSFGTSLIVPTLGIADIVNIAYGTQVPEYFDFLKTQPKRTNSTLNNVKVWFNNKGWIASVAYMNAINNVVLRSNLPSNVSSDYGIITINHPMNFTAKQLEIELIRQGGVSLLHAISVIFALSFVPASFVLYLIEERVSHSKHLQLVSGVNKLIYWVQTFSWDLMAYLMSSFLCILIFLAFNEQAYVSSTNFPGLLLLFLLYGWSCIPLMYPMSFVFSVPSSAFVSLSCANMFIGIITTVTTFVLAAFDDQELKDIDNIIKEVFLIFPHYCLGDGLMKLAANHFATASLMNLDIDFESNVLEWEFLGKNLLCMACFGVLFFLITLMIEFELYNIFRRNTELLFRIKYEQLAYRTARKVIVNFIPGYRIIRLPLIRAIMIPKLPSVTSFIDNIVDYMVLKVSSFIVTIRSSSSKDEEEDVSSEKKRIMYGDTSQDILIIKNLSKVYKRSKIPSVNQISCGVRSGECFGLLGLNGAGKTTTFKMLTGVISCTTGDATVMGYSINKDISKVRSLLGYCPQFDALDPLLTPYEHLILYGRIRNVPSTVLNRRVEDCLEQMNLLHYSSRLAGTLSGGNRRKLSTAIALIGNPPLIFLDEPTSGMDPKARRFLWSCIQDIIKGGGCVILTSHSMEECQALCTKLTVMVSGTFRCFGTSQHLKEKYGRGYRFIIRCKEQNIIKLKMHITSLFPSAKLVEEHSNQLRYEIMGLRLSQLFWEMEKLKKTTLLLDYSVSQTTLEEVFLTFANNVPEEK